MAKNNKKGSATIPRLTPCRFGWLDIGALFIWEVYSESLLLLKL